MLQTILAPALLALSSLQAVIAGSPSPESIIGNDSIQAYFPGEPGYQNASRAFNLRFDFEPLVVAYPNSTEEVAELVKAGAWLGVPGEAQAFVSSWHCGTHCSPAQSMHAPAGTHTQLTVSAVQTAT